MTAKCSIGSYWILDQKKDVNEKTGENLNKTCSLISINISTLIENGIMIMKDANIRKLGELYTETLCIFTNFL